MQKITDRLGDGLATYVGEPQHARRSWTDTGKRCFSLPQANRTLVLVRRIVEDLMVRHRQLLNWQDVYDAAVTRGHRPIAEGAQAMLVDLTGETRVCLEDLSQIGVYVEDWALGIVDFPFWSCGREVRLCWQYGESAVEHWHESAEGFNLRQPIETLLADELRYGQV